MFVGFTMYYHSPVATDDTMHGTSVQAATITPTPPHFATDTVKTAEQQLHHAQVVASTATMDTTQLASTTDKAISDSGGTHLHDVFGQATANAEHTGQIDGFTGIGADS